jgi:hypothetical protein
LLRDQSFEMSWMKSVASEVDKVALGKGIDVLVVSEY